MLDQTQRLTISEDHPSVYDQIWDSPGKVIFFYRSATHLVANIKDLTEVLKSDSEQVDYMEEQVGESSDCQRKGNTPTGKWSTTCTYDIYMVDTPRSSDGDDPNGGGGNDGNEWQWQWEQRR